MPHVETSVTVEHTVELTVADLVMMLFSSVHLDHKGPDDTAVRHIEVFNKYDETRRSGGRVLRLTWTETGETKT